MNINDDQLRHESGAGSTRPSHERTVDGVRLAYDDVGHGPAIVCLHAIGHGARDYAHLQERLRDQYRVIALDWPGQGRSGDDHTPASAVRYQALLERFLDELSLRRVVLVGNSIGAATAIRYAAAHPERTGGLVVTNSGGLDRPSWLTRLATRAFARFFAGGTRGAWWFPSLFGRYYRTVLQRTEADEARARIVASAREIAPVLVEAWRSFGEPAADLRPLVPSVRCPVLVAWAERDRIISIGRSLDTIRRFPDARLERFPAGHAPQLECPDLFAASVTRFLEERVIDPARAAAWADVDEELRAGAQRR